MMIRSQIAQDRFSKPGGISLVHKLPVGELAEELYSCSLREGFPMVKKSPCFVVIVLTLCLVVSSVTWSVVPAPLAYAQSVTSVSGVTSPSGCNYWNNFFNNHPVLPRVDCSQIKRILNSEEFRRILKEEAPHWYEGAKHLFENAKHPSFEPKP